MLPAGESQFYVRDLSEDEDAPDSTGFEVFDRCGEIQVEWFADEEHAVDLAGLLNEAWEQAGSPASGIAYTAEQAGVAADQAAARRETARRER